MSRTTNDDTTIASAVVPALPGTENASRLREELKHIEMILLVIQYRAALMDAVLLCRSRAEAEAHLTSTTAMTAAEVSRVMNVPFGDLTRDRREILSARKAELKALLRKATK